MEMFKREVGEKKETVIAPQFHPGLPGLLKNGHKTMSIQLGATPRQTNKQTKHNHFLSMIAILTSTQSCYMHLLS